VRWFFELVGWLLVLVFELVGWFLALVYELVACLFWRGFLSWLVGCLALVFK